MIALHSTRDPQLSFSDAEAICQGLVYHGNKQVYLLPQTIYGHVRLLQSSHTAEIAKLRAILANHGLLECTNFDSAVAKIWRYQQKALSSMNHCLPKKNHQKKLMKMLLIIAYHHKIDKLAQSPITSQLPMKHIIRFFLHTIALIASAPLLSAGYTVTVSDAFIEKAGKIFEHPNLRPNPHVGMSPLVTAAEKRVCRESAVAYMTAVFLEKHLATPTKKLDIAAPDFRRYRRVGKIFCPILKKKKFKKWLRFCANTVRQKARKRLLQSSMHGIGFYH